MKTLSLAIHIYKAALGFVFHRLKNLAMFILEYKCDALGTLVFHLVDNQNASWAEFYFPLFINDSFLAVLVVF